MSEHAPVSSPTARSSREWRVRPAGHSDVEAVAVAVRELLLELGGSAPELQAMEQATGTLIASPRSGVVLVAEAQQRVVGVLAASWQLAIHVPGSYALIQDLWVDLAWRGRALGAALLESLFALARAKQFERVEVGLPREGFVGFAATEAFYLGNGFTANGPRMRRLL